MSARIHTIETNWREVDATALEERVEVLNNWLDHTDDMIEMLDTDEEVRIKALTLEGLVRSRRNDFISAAHKLRTSTNIDLE